MTEINERLDYSFLLLDTRFFQVPAAALPAYGKSVLPSKAKRNPLVWIRTRNHIHTKINVYSLYSTVPVIKSSTVAVRYYSYLVDSPQSGLVDGGSRSYG